MIPRPSALVAAALLAVAGPAAAEDPFIIVQSTTSTQNSGLYDHILPIFEAESGIDVRVVAVGTGQAIKNAANCDGDVLLVHAKPAEQEFVADGFGTERHDVMYNDFVIVGPGDDPAGIAGMEDVTAALSAIAAAGSPFASRGDDSGTNKKEMRLWAETDVDPAAASGTWYRETGSGMGATLNTATAMGAYTMSDRATWVAFANKGDFEILVEGDPRLFNQYGIIPVSPEHCPSVKADLYRSRYENAILSDTTQGLGSYVFLWGQKQERTPTWYGMFMPTGEKTESVDVMQYLWTDEWPENRAPRIERPTLDGQTAFENVTLQPGQSVPAEVAVTDSDGDTLRYEWEVREESQAQTEGGDDEEVPPLIEGAVSPTDAAQVTVTAPTEPGAYRLFVNVYDGQNSAAHANIPFYVEG